jgi:hypothetical protein
LELSPVATATTLYVPSAGRLLHATDQLEPVEDEPIELHGVLDVHDPADVGQ